ncbi:hypothetical protein V1511DRAFT_496871 [Dipodascopsis uninucleata]
MVRSRKNIRIISLVIEQICITDTFSYSAMSILESQRYALEDIDQLEKAIADRLQEPPKTFREKVSQNHEIARFLSRIEEQSKFFLTALKDEDGGRAKEMGMLLGGENAPIEEFYLQLADIKEFHGKYPNQPVENLEESYRKRRRVTRDIDEFDEEHASQTENVDPIDTMFTGEESLGRFLDLISFHERYVNLRGTKRVSYIQYLDLFDKFGGVSRSENDAEYVKYVRDLAEYLEGFLKRTRPLEDPEGMLLKIENDFDREWATRPRDSDADANGNSDPLYCEVCDRKFEKQTVFDSHLNGKKHKRNLEHKASALDVTHKQKNSGERARELERLQYRISKLGELLEPQRNETKINVERKSALTERERQIELEAFEKEELGIGEDEDDGDDDDDSRVYNPLKLPLGWDGKPIPFWLWKLHGLGIEYPCEICGNFVYMGRKAFDKHFLEARHVHGLRCLGIQNSSLFREITSIQDALALWEKIKKERRIQESMREQTVEMEDDEGNVMSERVYNDLKKQGLL